MSIKRADGARKETVDLILIRSVSNELTISMLTNTNLFVNKNRTIIKYNKILLNAEFNNWLICACFRYEIIKLIKFNTLVLKVLYKYILYMYIYIIYLLYI